MKNLKVNTDNISRFKIKNEPVENILIYGNTINRFGEFYDYSSNGSKQLYMCCNGIYWKRFKWLLKQIDKYKANVYIICNQKTIDYYQAMLKWMIDDWYNVDISNVKLLKEGEKDDILEKFGEL